MWVGLGAHVRNGEKGYTVFSVEEIDGLPEHQHGKPDVQLTPVERISHAEAFFQATKADVRYRGDRASTSRGSRKNKY